MNLWVLEDGHYRPATKEEAIDMVAESERASTEVVTLSLEEDWENHDWVLGAVHAQLEDLAPPARLAVLARATADVVAQVLGE